MFKRKGVNKANQPKDRSLELIDHIDNGMDDAQFKQAVEKIKTTIADEKIYQRILIKAAEHALLKKRLDLVSFLLSIMDRENITSLSWDLQCFFYLFPPSRRFVLSSKAFLPVLQEHLRLDFSNPELLRKNLSFYQKLAILKMLAQNSSLVKDHKDILIATLSEDEDIRSYRFRFPIPSNADLEKPIDLFDNEGNVLLLAIIAQQNDVVEELLRNGFDPNSKTLEGTTALHFAVLANNIEAAKLLYQYAKENFYDDMPNEFGKTPMDYARSRNLKDFYDILDKNEQHRSKFNYPTSGDLIMIALENQDVNELVAYLQVKSHRERLYSIVSSLGLGQRKTLFFSLLILQRIFRCAKWLDWVKDSLLLLPKLLSPDLILELKKSDVIKELPLSSKVELMYWLLSQNSEKSQYAFKDHPLFKEKDVAYYTDANGNNFREIAHLYKNAAAVAALEESGWYPRSTVALNRNVELFYPCFALENIAVKASTQPQEITSRGISLISFIPIAPPPTKSSLTMEVKARDEEQAFLGQKETNKGELAALLGSPSVKNLPPPVPQSLKQAPKPSLELRQLPRVAVLA